MYKYVASIVVMSLCAALQASPIDSDQRDEINALFGTGSDRIEVRDTLAARNEERLTNGLAPKTLWHENKVLTKTLGESFTAETEDMNYSQGGFLKLATLTNRRALTGPGCTVNKLITVVGVGATNSNLNNLTDEDPDNYATFVRVVSAGVTVDPVVSIRDMENYYAAGLKAGFCITASSGSTVLTLDVISAYSISFYRDGHRVGTKALEAGGGLEGVQLSLIQIPGSDDACVMLTATSDWVFDEVCLDRSGGVQASLGDVLKVKYAFVGSDELFAITRKTTGDVSDGKPIDGGLLHYSEYTGRDIRLDYIKGWTPVLGIPTPLVSASVEKMVDLDLDNQVTLPTVLAVGYQGGAKFMTKDADDPTKEVFEAGTEVGFNYTKASALDLSAGVWIRLILYDRDGNKIQEQTVNSAGLGLGIASGNGGSASVTATVPFSGAEIRFHTVASLDVGGLGIKYAYVRMKPDTWHRCKIDPTPDTRLCSEQNTFQLRSNPDVPVTWSRVYPPSTPEGDAKTDVRVTEAGFISGLGIHDKEYDLLTLDADGNEIDGPYYIFRALASDGKCEEYVRIYSGAFGQSASAEGTINSCTTALVNKTGEEPIYELSDEIYGSSGSLLSKSDVSNAENLLTDEFETYAEYIGGASLASNLRIIGVKRKDGNLIFDGEDNEKDGKEGKRIGFVVEASSSVLDLSAVQLLQIRCYDSKAKKEVYRSLIAENNVVSAKLIGSSKMTKMRYSITVPNKDSDGNYIKMDEMMLWTSGVLNVGASTMRFYYAFIEDTDSRCGDPLYACEGSMLISNSSTRATINADETKQGGVASVGSVTNNLSHLIDDDPETYVGIMQSVSLGGGVTLAVNMGRTMDYHHQLGIILDNKTYLASVGLGSWMTVETYYQGTATGDKFTDWSVLGANVAGYGDKSYIYMQPTSPYDEVRIKINQVLGALESNNIYGIFVRGDADNDGIPDCQDKESCTTTIDDIQITSVCVGDKVVVSAKGNVNVDYKLKFSDPSAKTAEGYKEEDGMVHKTSHGVTGMIEVSYTSEVAGLFQMIFYDATNRPISSTYYTVHPTLTTWLTTATNNDWNKWDNWSDGSPYCCTDVIIPTGAKYYPELPGTITKEDADKYCCQSIHFQPGGAVGDIYNLDYAQAWVETEMEPNRYHLFSPPLHYMYTGDMFVPVMRTTDDPDAGRTDEEKYFYELNYTSGGSKEWQENRFNPTIYQRLWYKDTTGRLWQTDEKSDAEKYEALAGYEDLTSLSLTKWSRHFNLLQTPYELGQGYSIWVDNGNLPDDRLFTFRFPKWHGTYNYFSDFDQQPIDKVTETLERRKRTDDQPARFRNLAGERFIYETESSSNIPFTFPTETAKYKKFEDRVVYNSDATFPATVSLTAEESTSHFVFGNPFMSRIDVAAFLLANKATIKAVKFYDGNTLKTIALTTAEEVTGTDEVSFIAPMQAVLVETPGEATGINLTLTREMLSGQHSPQDAATTSAGTRPKSAQIPTPSLTISATTGGHTATMRLLEGDDLHTAALLDNEVLPTVALFGLNADGEACDILPSRDEIPLGIFCAHPDTVLLSFRARGQFPRDDYRLLDRETGTTWELYDDILLPLTASSAGRYVICRTAATGLSSPHEASKPDVRISVSGHEATVRADRPIADLSVYDLSGRRLHHLQPAATSSSISLPAGIAILSVRLTDGSELRTKVMSREK